MLPIVLVLLVATSALAAPSIPNTVTLTAINYNEAVPPKHNGNIVSAYHTYQAMGVLDDGELPAYVLTAQNIIHDLANRGDRRSQALAVGETIALLAPLAAGRAGDSCSAAALVNAYVLSVRTGNKTNLRAAIVKFVQTLAAGIDNIVKLGTNPNSVRYATGPRGGCSGEGRTYQFEEAWDSILSNANPSSASLVNEQYCAAKRLYTALSASNNNVAAFLTAMSLPPMNDIVAANIEPIARFVSAIGTSSASVHAVHAKAALNRI